MQEGAVVSRREVIVAFRVMEAVWYDVCEAIIDLNSPEDRQYAQEFVSKSLPAGWILRAQADGSVIATSPEESLVLTKLRSGHRIIQGSAAIE